MKIPKTRNQINKMLSLKLLQELNRICWNEKLMPHEKTYKIKLWTCRVLKELSLKDN